MRENRLRKYKISDPEFSTLEITYTNFTSKRECMCTKQDSLTTYGHMYDMFQGDKPLNDEYSNFL